MLYSFGAFFVSLAIFIPRLLPEKLDLYTDQEKNLSGDSTDISESDAPHGVTVISLLRDPNYTLAALAGCMGYFQYDYLGPILAPRLAELSLSRTQIGLFFTICAVVYIATCFSLPWIAR